jgi:hypothetical protein
MSKFLSWPVCSKYSSHSTAEDKQDPCVDVTSSVSFLLSVSHHVTFYVTYCWLGMCLFCELCYQSGNN